MTDLRTRMVLGAGRPPQAEPARFLDAVARATGLARRPAYRLRLACDELTTNIAEHGYADRPGAVDLAAGRWGGCVWLRIEDDAAPFDPTAIRRPPPYTRVGSGIGGAGLVLVRGIVDRFEYEFADGRNRTLVAVRRDEPMR
jgi:serine/threonine-protein kinase RsbW